MKKTVSPYVDASNWDLCRQLGFNMSEEIDKLLEILISTALEIQDEEGRVMMTRRIRLEKHIGLLEVIQIRYIFRNQLVRKSGVKL